MVLSLAEDTKLRNYAKEHFDDNKMKNYLDNITHKTNYARWTKTQVHNLKTDCQILVNIKKVHDKHNILTSYEEDVIEVPWLPKRSWYIQLVDEETGLPRELESKPNSNCYNEYFHFNDSFDVTAVVHSGALSCI